MKTKINKSRIKKPRWIEVESKNFNSILPISQIELIVYDFDGVMTDNKVIIDQDGKESVIANRSDGLAVTEFKKLGLSQIILSTERNLVVQRRAEKLRILCLNDVENKKSTLEEYLDNHYIDKNKVIYCGNDINDLDAMRFVGFPVAPSDANWRIKNIAKYITRAKGGEGVIREIYDLLTQSSTSSLT